MSGNADEQTEQALKDEILHPEVSLHTARAKLNHHQREEATTNHVQTISLTRSFQGVFRPHSASYPSIYLPSS